MVDPIVRDYNKKTHKRCIKCRTWKARKDIIDPETEEVIEKHAFGAHNSSDGLQSICFLCKNAATGDARNKNVNARIRHHTATRCLTQLGELAPAEFTKNLEDYLGYRIHALVKHLRSDLQEREGADRKLRDALNDGYHIDHIHPLHTYKVITSSVDGVERVDWEEFRRCWAMDNLSAIPALENLQKGGKVITTEEEQVTEENG